MPLTLGLTGGIASGKSLVGQYFLRLGATVIDADQVSRDVVCPESIGLRALVAHFGAEILDAQGEMDRARMRTRVFNNPAARVELEKILHPLIRQRLLELRDIAIQAGTGTYCMLMIPLLVKFGWSDLVDRLLVVDCPEEIQLQRLIARDNMDENLANKILMSQDSRSQRLEAADDIILNNGSPAELLEAVQRLHKQYEELSLGTISQLNPQKV